MSLKRCSYYDIRGDKMKRQIKFRAWDKISKVIIPNLQNRAGFQGDMKCENHEIMQYVGLKDKLGVEIYEFMEIDNKWEVQYLNSCYILIDISNRDTIPLYKYMEQKDGQVTVTKEYTKV